MSPPIKTSENTTITIVTDTSPLSITPTQKQEERWEALHLRGRLGYRTWLCQKRVGTVGSLGIKMGGITGGIGAIGGTIGGRTIGGVTGGTMGPIGGWTGGLGWTIGGTMCGTVGAVHGVV